MMKANDHKRVGELLQELAILREHIESDYLWDLHLVVHRDWKRTVPEPLSKLWEEARTEVECLFKHYLFRQMRSLELRLRDLGVDLKEGGKE